MSMSEVEWIDIFAGNLASLLEETNMSQSELADAIGVSKGTISRYLNKQMMPSVKTIVNMVYALNCPWEDLLDFGDTID